MDSTVNSTGNSASSDYRKKRIKNVQKLELVRMMKANFLFIRGKHAVARSEKSRADVWKVITSRLNSLGPPVQSAEAWQRRWNDMRSATKSKMTKIQNYVREHGEDCPFKLNLVERLIWDTFSVKPEEYMKDLNMKLWREKQQTVDFGPSGQQSVADSISSCSSQVSMDQTFDGMGWSNIGSTGQEGTTAWPSSTTMPTKDNLYGPESNVHQAEYGSQPQPISMGYQSYADAGSTHTTTNARSEDVVNPWYSAEREDTGYQQEKTTTATATTDLVPGSKVLRDLNKLFDLVLRQNEEILQLLRQSAHSEP
uniref:Regulatory protein zeste n=1 Tax=Anopheles farauti TaxID=69004 RepID=A0A182QW78_9DIPT